MNKRIFFVDLIYFISRWNSMQWVRLTYILFVLLKWGSKFYGWWIECFCLIFSMFDTFEVYFISTWTEQKHYNQIFSQINRNLVLDVLCESRLLAFCLLTMWSAINLCLHCENILLWNFYSDIIIIKYLTKWLHL